MPCWIDEVLDGAGMKSLTFYAGDVFCIYLGSLYADFQEKIFPETSGKKFQTFHCSNVTTMKSFELSPRRFREVFFLKIGIQRAKVYTKNVPNIEVRMWLHPWPVQNFAFHASHCSALLIGWLHLWNRVYIYTQPHL